MEFRVYKDKKGKWRWQAVNSSNGKIVADGGQGYASKSGAKKGLKAFRLKVLRAELVE